MQQCNNISIHTKETSCSKLNILLNNQINHELLPEKWIPVKTSHQCIVVCRSLTTRKEELEKVADGTACFIEGYNKSVCVNGICQCIVVCRSLKTGKEEELEKVADGTACFIEGYNKSVCVNGICQVKNFKEFMKI
ncbi:unnamed protein product [Onchocerca flexuosa]|uniref:Uncharacterized protein n=1 Tax=Onchocerca flexuosa TaxID=387005 RepID=A0A183I6X5_9BILA|nr:unnamed protein product [Onchocerca flexuosa]